jgi:hypothetical protein
MTDKPEESAAGPQLRNMPTADLWKQFHAFGVELRCRHQIAFTYWSLEDIDAKFDACCKSLELTDMEPHRTRFRNFALGKIGYFLGCDAAFNNRVKRELMSWVKKHAGTAALASPGDDWRADVESWGQP